MVRFPVKKRIKKKVACKLISYQENTSTGNNKVRRVENEMKFPHIRNIYELNIYEHSVHL